MKIRKNKTQTIGWVKVNLTELTTPEKIKFKPCPFCGITPTCVTLVQTVAEKLYSVNCKKCQSTTGYYDSPYKASEAWNKRI